MTGRTDETGETFWTADLSGPRAHLPRRAMAFLEAHSARVFCGRIPTDRRFVVCLAALELPDGARVDVCGIGETDRQAATAAAGEAAETLSQLRRPGDVTAIPLAHLLGRVCPQGYMRGRRLADGAAVAVPVTSVLRDVPQLPGGSAASEGCAAGETFEDAALAAVFELVERDALACWWRSGRQARLVLQALAARQGGETRTMALLDIGAGALAPVAVMLSTGFERAGLALAAAARATAAEAREAAAREMAQRELALLRERPEPPLADLAGLIGETAPPDAVSDDLPPGRAAERLAALAARAEAENVEIALVELTRAEFGIPVVKAISPGLVSSRSLALHPRLAATCARYGPPPPSRGDHLPI